MHADNFLYFISEEKIEGETQPRRKTRLSKVEKEREKLKIAGKMVRLLCFKGHIRKISAWTSYLQLMF